jgi:putative flippase GtrA
MLISPSGMRTPGLGRGHWQQGLLPGSGAEILRHSRAARLLCFACTGGIAALVQLGILDALSDGHWTPFQAEAAALLLSTQVNFFLSYLFTWRNRRLRGWMPRMILGRWAAYQGTAAMAAILNISVFALGRTDLPTLEASALGTAIAAIINYVACDRLVFRARRLIASESGGHNSAETAVQHG